MNKKLATLMFAIGLGVASSPALASCIYMCTVDYNNCLKYGGTAAECEIERDICDETCSSGG